MERVARTATSAVFLSALLLSGHASGQATAPGGETEGRALSGKWSGSFDVTQPDGRIQRNTAVLILKQHGSSIEGSIGESEDRQSPIKGGKADGRGIRFTIDFDGGRSMGFQLRPEGGRLKGEASGETPNGRMAGVLDLTRVRAEAGPPSKLFDEISSMDGALFAAFNARDLEAVKGFFAEDLEFYHDKEGLTDYAKNMDSFQRHFSSTTKVRRELVAGTLEVYPLGAFGAVETGVHRFYSTESGQPEKLTATVKFVHVWRRKDGRWEISRVISYDHR